MSETKFDENLSGKGVLTQDGREIGKLSDLVVDSASWRVRALVVKLDRDLLDQFDLKKPMFGTVPLDIPVDFVSGIGDKVVLHKKLGEVIDFSKGVDGGDDDDDEDEGGED